MPFPITQCFARVPFLLFPEKPRFFMPTCNSFCLKWFLLPSTYLSFEIKIFYFQIFRQPSLSSLLTQSNVLSVHSPFPMAALLLLLRLVVTPEPLSHSIRAASLHHSESACKHDLLVLLRWLPILSWFIILYFTNKEHREKSCPFILWIHRLPLTASHWILLKYILAQSSL